MKKNIRKFAIALSVFMFVQPVIFADAKLNKEILALEMELVKMNTKTGEYADMSKSQLEKEKTKLKKTLEKKKAKAKKETEADLKKAGKEIKEASKKAGKELKEAGKDIGSAVKDLFD